VHTTDAWIVFPHSLAGLSLEEIKVSETELAPVLDLLEP